MNEAAEGEVVDGARAVVVAPQREVINIDQAVAEWEAYQELTKRLLTKEDYQRIGDKEFKKKSAWRKYAKSFNISCEEVSSEIVRAEDGYPIYARVVVRATEPSGRWQDADQECHVIEKCCVAARSRSCPKRHTHCLPGCDGRIHFSHPGDIPAVAFTRAKNRAISDLIGAGEVSFEEAEVGGASSRPARRPAAAKAAEAGGAANGDGKARHELRAALDSQFHDDEQAAWAFVNKEYPDATDETHILWDKIPVAECARLTELLKAGT
jgi:hypothetical protein